MTMKGVPNASSSGDAQGTAGTGIPAAFKRPKQRRLAIDVGVAAAGDTGRSEFEDIGVERLTGSTHNVEAEGQPGVAVLHRRQIGDATVRSTLVLNEFLQTSWETVVSLRFGTRIYDDCSHCGGRESSPNSDSREAMASVVCSASPWPSMNIIPSQP